MADTERFVDLAALAGVGDGTRRDHTGAQAAYESMAAWVAGETPTTLTGTYRLRCAGVTE